MSKETSTVKNMGKNVILYMAAQIIAKVASLILLPIYTYYLDPAELGIYEYIRSYLAIITILSTLGFSTFYLRFYSTENDKRSFNGTIFWFLICWNIMLFILGVIAVPFIMKVLDAPCGFWPFMFIALGYQFFLSFEIIPMRTYRINGEVKKYFAISVLKAVLQIFAIIVVLKVLHMGLAGRYMAELFIAIIFAIIFIVYMIKNSTNKIDKNIIKRGLKFSLPLVPSDLLQIGSNSMCVIIIEKMLSVTQLGLYSVGLSISTIINTVTTSMWYAIEPELYLRSESNDLNTFFVKIKRIYLAVTMAVCVVSGLFVQEAIMLVFPGKYAGVGGIVQVLAFSYMMAGLYSLYNQLVIMQNKTNKLFGINLAKVIMSLGSCILLIPLFGANALGWSYFLGYLVSFLVAYAVIDRNIERERTLYKDYLLILLGGVIIFMSRLLDGFSIGEGVLIKMCMFALYCICIMRIYGLKLDEIVGFIKKKK